MDRKLLLDTLLVRSLGKANALPVLVFVSLTGSAPARQLLRERVILHYLDR